jgi:hypothetical protein
MVKFVCAKGEDADPKSGIRGAAGAGALASHRLYHIYRQPDADRADVKQVIAARAVSGQFRQRSIRGTSWC